MLLKSIVGFAAAIACLLQLNSVSNAQPGGNVRGNCRIETAQIGQATFTVDVRITAGNRCWMVFDSRVSGLKWNGAPRCGTLNFTEGPIGWEFIAGSQPCIDEKFVVTVVYATANATVEYTFNVEPR